jgi:transcriptional regulator with XRE-family HTH domain
MDFMSELGDAIRAGRERRGLTQAELAREFGISKSAVNQWESGRNVPDQRKLGTLVRVLGLDPAVAAGVPQTATGAAATGAFPGGPDEPSPAATRLLREMPAAGRPDIAVWASAEAGHDGAMVLVNDPIDYIRRSERMLGVRNPFAFYVIGSSMSPAIEHGDQVVIHPGMPPQPGKDHVFLQQQPDGTMLALVKRLVRSTTTAWKVRQFNPPRDFDLPKSKWSKALMITEKRVG